GEAASAAGATAAPPHRGGVTAGLHGWTPPMAPPPASPTRSTDCSLPMGRVQEGAWLSGQPLSPPFPSSSSIAADIAMREAAGVPTCPDIAGRARCCSGCWWHCARSRHSAAVTKTNGKFAAGAAGDSTSSALFVVSAESRRVGPRDPGQGPHSHCHRTPPQSPPLTFAAAMPPSPPKLIEFCRCRPESPDPPSGPDPGKLPNPALCTSTASPNGTPP
ncbi:hypothetical protein VaNZ11_007145, partial [Volvox africanus]